MELPMAEIDSLTPANSRSGKRALAHVGQRHVSSKRVFRERHSWLGVSLLKHPNHRRAPDGIEWRAIVVSIEFENTESRITRHGFEMILFDERELHR